MMKQKKNPLIQYIQKHGWIILKDKDEKAENVKLWVKWVTFIF